MIRDSFLPVDSNLICLFSAMSTGMHFTRLVLESDPKIDFVLDDTGPGQIIDLNLEFVKRMLWCAGKDGFYKTFLEERKRRSIALYKARKLFHKNAYPDIEMENKNEDFLIYRVFFIHVNLATFIETFQMPFHSYIIPVRHPILSAISILRKSESIRDAYIRIFEYNRVMLHVFSQKHPMFVFVNPWGIHGFYKMFERLGLEIGSYTKRILENPPVINPTTVTPYVINGPVVTFDVRKKPELIEARDMICNGKGIHESMIEIYSMFKYSGLMNEYERVCKENGAMSCP
jgi:hypothetical protein